MKLHTRSIPGIVVFVVALNFTLLKCGASDALLNAVSLVLGFAFYSLAMRDQRLAEGTP